MKLSYLLLPFCMVGMALAGDCGTASCNGTTHDGHTNDGDGGVYNITEATTIQDENFTNCYATWLGGAIYVDFDTELTLSGTCYFNGNHMEADQDELGWYGYQNDIYLAEGATLVVESASESDTVTLATGICSDGANNSVVKNGVGTLILGGSETGDAFDEFGSSLELNGGKTLIKTSVNALGSISVVNDADVIIGQNASLNIVNPATGSNIFAISARSGAEEAVVSGFSISEDADSNSWLAQGNGSSAALLQDTVLALYNTGGTNYSISDVALQNSTIKFDSIGSGSVKNVVLDEYSSLDADNCTISLQGTENELTIGLAGAANLTADSFSTSQLNGIAGAENSAVYIILTPELLAELNETFAVTLSGFTAAEQNFVIATGKSLTGSLTIGSWENSSDGLVVNMSYIIPEPATATLSLLALAGFALRRRRQY